MKTKSQILVFVIDIVTNIVLGMLGLRLLLKLFGSSTDAPFVRWVYETTQPLLTPFIGMFPSPKVDGFVIEFSVVFALILYLFVSYAILEVVEALVGASEKHHHHHE